MSAVNKAFTKHFNNFFPEIYVFSKEKGRVLKTKIRSGGATEKKGKIMPLKVCFFIPK